MQCKDVRKLLLDFCEGTLTDGQRADVEAHLKTCLPCRKRHDHLLVGLQVIKQVASVKPIAADGSIDRLLAKLKELPPPPKRRARAAVVAGSALSLVALAALLLAWIPKPSVQPQQARMTAPPAPAEAIKEPVLAALSKPSDSKSEAKKAKQTRSLLAAHPSTSLRPEPVEGSGQAFSGLRQKSAAGVEQSLAGCRKLVLSLSKDSARGKPSPCTGVARRPLSPAPPDESPPDEALPALWTFQTEPVLVLVVEPSPTHQPLTINHQPSTIDSTSSLITHHSSFVQVTDPEKGEIRRIKTEKEVDADGNIKHSFVSYIVEPMSSNVQ